MRKIIPIVLLQFVWLIVPAQERQWFSEADIAGIDFPGDARNNAVSFVINDIAYIGTGDAGSTTTDFWKFEPITKTWTQIAEFPGDRRGKAVAFTLNGKGYVGTGKGAGEYYKDFWRYDPVDNTWTEIANFGGDGRSSAVAFTLNGIAYVGSGETSSANYTNDFWKYNPSSDTWTAIANLPGNARTGAFTFATEDFGYVGGGYRPGPNTVIDLYSYDPDSDTWEEKGNGYEDFRRENGVAFVLDDKAYIGLGLSKQDFLIYDIVTETTTNNAGPEDDFGSSGETSRWGAVVFVIKDKAFVGLGGANGGTVTNNDIWSFQYPVPDAPEALTVTDFTLAEVSLQWNDLSNNEQGFAVERSVGDDASFSLLASLSADITTYQDNTIESDEVYYYRVQAIGQSDNSAYTQSVSVNTYSAPDNLVAMMEEDTTISLSWQDNSTIETGFAVERSADGGTSFSSLNTLEANTVTYVDTQVTPGIDYLYRVYAIVDDISTNTTNVATAGVLTNPTDLSVAATTSTTVRLSWSYVGLNATHYVVERKIDDADFAELSSTAIGTSKQYSDTDVEEAQQYTYRIKTTDATRTSDYSLSVQATTALHAPEAVTATVEDSIVSIQWKDISQHETHYVVQRSFADGSGIVVIDTLAANTVSFQDTTPLDSGDYQYIVHAIGTVTSSACIESNAITIVPKTETTEEEQPKEEEELQEEENEEVEENEEEVVTGIDDRDFAEIIKVYPNPSNGPVSVYVGSERFAYVAVFNSQGRLVHEVQQAEQGSSAVVSVDLQYLPVGVYTMRVYTARGVVIKKIAKQ